MFLGCGVKTYDPTKDFGPLDWIMTRGFNNTKMYVDVRDIILEMISQEESDHRLSDHFCLVIEVIF